MLQFSHTCLVIHELTGVWYAVVIFKMRLDDEVGVIDTLADGMIGIMMVTFEVIDLELL